MFLTSSHYCVSTANDIARKKLTYNMKIRGFSSVKLLFWHRILVMFLTSTPKKAVLSQTNLIQCLICAEVLETTDRIAVYGRSQWDLRGTICKILGGELQSSNKDSQYVCKKKCFPKLIKVEKMTSTLKNLQDELRAEISKNAVVRIKRRLSQDQTQDVPMPGPISPSLEATPKPIKKSLFPSNATQNVARFPAPISIVGYQEVRPSAVPVVMRAFPSCARVNNRGSSSLERVNAYQSPSTGVGVPKRKVEAEPKSNAIQDPYVKVGGQSLHRNYHYFYY